MKKQRQEETMTTAELAETHRKEPRHGRRLSSKGYGLKK
jgi:hypothetical protein